MNIDDKWMLAALQRVRDGGDDLYERGINFGYALGMICAYRPGEQMYLRDLLMNASEMANHDRQSARAAA